MALCVRKGGTTLRQKWCVLSLDMALLVSMTLVVRACACNSCSTVTSVHGICSRSVNVFQRVCPRAVQYIQGKCCTYRVLI